MSQWGSLNQANNAPVWAAAQLRMAPNTANRDALYQNTTADAVTPGATVGLYAVGTLEKEYGFTGAKGVASISVTAPGTGFTARPTITVTNAASDSTGSGATATAVGIVVTAALNAVGSGGSYVPGEILTISTGAGTAATLNVAQTAIRAAPSVTVPGSGYANGDTISFADGTGTQGVFTVTTGAANTGVASLALTSNGAYTVNPSLTNAATTNVTGSGTGCQITANTRVKTVSVVNVGAYTTLPTLTGVGHATANGSGATFNLTIGCGPVTITAPGTAYTAVPDVAVGGTGGSGATATATLTPAGGPAAGVAHEGWVLVTQGTGGRAGRIQTEVLVAGDISNDDSADDVLFQQ